MSETPQTGSHAQGDDKLQRQASQLAYDVKYKVKQKLGKDSKLSPAQVTKAYMQQLAASPAPSGVKALAKKKLVGEDYTSFMKDSAKDLVLETLSKVFIEGVKEEVKEEVVSEADEKKYKVRVTDKASGNTYVTNATRAKIAELRANKNISSVEMTGYGTAIQTKADGGKKAKKDYDGDGKVESGAKEHAGAVHNAIQRKKGGVADGKDTRKEEVIYETEDKDGEKKITGKGVNNKKLIKVMPNLGEAADVEQQKQQKLSNLKRLQMKKQQLERQKLNLQKQGKLPMGEACDSCEDKKVDKKEDEDERARPTKMSLIKNKMRSRGIQVAGLDIAPRNMKTGGDELGEGKDPCWDTHKQVGMKKKGGKMVPNCVPKEEVAVDEATYPSDFVNPDGSKRAVAKKKTGRPIQHDQPTSGGRRKTVDEEASDAMKDRRMERGGVGGNQRYDRAPKAPNTKKFGSGKTMAQKEMEKKYGKGASAMDIVRSQIRAKHGKGSIK
jgi:hypothetical protein